MIVEGLIISLVVGKLRGGKISRISSLELNKWYLFIVSFIMEFLLLYGYQKDIPFLQEYAFYFHLASYIFLFIGFIFNIKNAWLGVAFLGILLNAIVIFINGGKMPVSVDALNMSGLQEYAEMLMNNQVATHQVLTRNMTAWYLGDVLPLVPPYPLPKVISIGDILITLGVFFMLQRVMNKKKKLFMKSFI